MDSKQVLNEFKDFINEFCEKIGPRPPASVDEKRAAILFQNKLEKYCDETKSEEFTVQPDAYKAAFRIPMIFYCFALIFYKWSFWIALLLSFCSVLIFIIQTNLALPLLDPLFPKKKSINVIGKIKPNSDSEKTKKIIVIGSHLDSNWEFTLMRKWGYKFAIIIALNFFLNIILFLFLIVFKIGIISKTIEIIFVCCFIVGTIPVLIQLFFLISNTPVMGANDNLAGMSVSYLLAKYFSKEENQLKNIEIWISAFGCEEIGSRGSRAFIKKHYNELKNASVLNLDMIGNRAEMLTIHKGEITGMVKLDKKLAQKVKKSAEELSIPVKIENSMAYTDSMSFARRGISATSICSLPESSEEFYYHTCMDTIERVEFESLLKTFNICVHFLKEINKQ